MRRYHEQGLGPGAQLALEEHLQRCATCRRRVAFDHGVRELVEDIEPSSLSESDRRRVLSAALLASGQHPVEDSVSNRPGWHVGLLGWGTAAAVASGALGVLLVSLGDGSLGARPRSVEQGSGPSAAVVASPREAAAPVQKTLPPRWQPLTPQARSLRGVNLRAKSAGARVLPTEDGTLRVRGSVQVEAKGPQPRRIEHAHYAIAFVAAKFVAQAESVHVAAGEVRVQRDDGVSVRVKAGERWPSKREPTAAAGSSRRKASRRAPAEAPKSTGERVAQARQWLAEGDVHSAEALAEEVLGRTRRGLWRAEAQTLLAECSAARGAWAQAIARYERVAKQYPDTVAGQNALFAAGRTAQRAGQAARAQQLWQRYLRRYPQGLFQDDVRRRLADH